MPSGSSGKSIAIFAHSHPFFSKGGGEIIAYSSYQEFRRQGHCVNLYCGINPDHRPGVKIFESDEQIIKYDENEYIFSSQGFNPFSHTHCSSQHFASIVDILRKNETQIVHFHHFWNVGTDFIYYVMSNLPGAKFIITLHELLAICYADGQMVKRGSNALCYKASSIDCHLCFPEVSRTAFSMRHEYMRSFLEKFDAIISPSEFLAARVTEWGLSRDIYVLENGYHTIEPEPDLNEEKAANLTRRFAFFGQPTFTKGMEIFVSAALRCVASGRRDMSFALYGCDRSKFLLQCGSQWEAAINSAAAYIQFHGVYDPAQVFTLMRQNGYIVIPSTWWENSPLVIQESYIAGRPPIVANIGGMAEKVLDGTSGIHFYARNSVSLSDVMMGASGDVDLWTRLRSGRILPPSVDEMNNTFLEICGELQA